MQGILKENVFPEPRLVVLSAEKGNWNCVQGFVVVERELMFKVENFSMLEGIVSLIATYYTFYISHPKSLYQLKVFTCLSKTFFNTTSVLHCRW